MTTDGCVGCDVGLAKRIMDVLPDEILLEIFDFNIIPEHASYGSKRKVESWQPLVHVCRRWRNLVFGSPRRLNLRLYCTPKTPKDTLEVWPPLPLIVDNLTQSNSGTHWHNVIAALGQSNRVRVVSFSALSGWQLEEVLAVMQVPFPKLTDLRITSDCGTVPVIPDSFLNGSAPRPLLFFELTGIPFPGLPNLLLSATHLVCLRLLKIPHSGYLSSESMAALLSVLSSLTIFSLEFESPQSRPDSETRSLAQPKPSILPALDIFCFKGVPEYLEVLVTFIEAPRLDNIHITFFDQIDFDCQRLAQFISRTPILSAPDEARVQFGDSTASLRLQYGTSVFRLGDSRLQIGIQYRELDRQLLSIERVCNSSFHPLSTIKDLYIERSYGELVWKNDAIENILWSELLLPFTEVENLYLSEEFAPDIAAALQELVEGRMTEVLPSLKNVFVEGLNSWGPVHEIIRQVAAARRRSGHPITISVWDIEPKTFIYCNMKWM